MTEPLHENRRSRGRVAIVRHDRFPGEPHLRRSVHALRDAGFDVDVFCDREVGLPRIERTEGVRVLRLLFQHKRHSFLRYVLEYSLLPLLAGLLVSLVPLPSKYVYLEIDNPPDWLVLAGLIPRIRGTTVVLYMFENMAELMASDHGFSAHHPLVRMLLHVQRLSARLAHHLIVPHEMARRILIDQGIGPESIVAVVPNVPDEQVFFARLPELALVKQVPKTIAYKTGFRLVTHGTLLERYGIDTLLEAVSLIRDDIPGLSLEIIGDGEHRSNLQELVSDLALGETVTFTDRVPFDHLAPRLLNADLGIVPMWAPFVPNKLMEYLALKLPVIATDWPSLRLYFDDSDVCYVEPKNSRALADAILDLYGHPERRDTLARKGHTSYRQKFAWEQTKQTYLQVYAHPPATSVDPVFGERETLPSASYR